MSTYFQLQSGTVIESDTPEVWASDKTAKRISAAKGRAILKDEARASLLSILKPGDTVHCVLRHVSSSGMSRRIDFYKVVNNEHVVLTGYIGNLCGYRHSRDGGLVVSGCGMDMGFSVVYDLSRTLFQGNFICTGENCRSNDHSNGDRNRKPHQHSDGGYALTHRWL